MMNPYAGRRPATVPPPVAAALAELDRLATALRDARKGVAELDERRHDGEAEQRDRDAARAAATAGKPVPDATNARGLADQRALARRTAQAYEDAVGEAARKVDEARRVAHEKGAAAEATRQAKAHQALHRQAADLAEAMRVEHDARFAAHWLRHGPETGLTRPPSDADSAVVSAPRDLGALIDTTFPTTTEV